MGGSILPVTIHNGKIYFLFGKERDIDDNPGWSDFGGGTDANETYIQTAIREAGEELTGFLGDSKTIKKMLSKYGTYNIDYNSPGHNTYRCHIFPVKSDNNGIFEYLPYYYNNNQRFLQKRLPTNVIRDTKIFEKVEIKWFSFDDIIKHHKQFRSFYQHIIHLILGNKSALESFVFKALLNTKKSKTRKTNTKKTNTKKTNTKKTRV
jgi:8-oxo-dGTP pyrophosphatase MutT (NUDIX family)